MLLWPEALPHPQPQGHTSQRERTVAETEVEGGPPRLRLENVGQATKLPQSILMTGTQLRTFWAFIDYRANFGATPWTMPVWIADAYEDKLVQLKGRPKVSYVGPRYSRVQMEVLIVDQLSNEKDASLADNAWLEGTALFDVAWTVGDPSQVRPFVPQRPSGVTSVPTCVVKILEAFDGSGLNLISAGGINDVPGVSPDYIDQLDVSGMAAGTTIVVDSAHADAGAVISGGGAPSANTDVTFYEDSIGDAKAGKASIVLTYVGP